MMKIQTSMILAVAALAMASSGCKKEPAEEPVQQPTATTPPPPVETAPPPQTGCDAANMAAFTGIFTSRAPTEAPKMQMDGPMVCGNVPEGGTVTGPAFMIQMGKCYTVIANGLPNITEIDVALMVDATAVGLPANIAAMAATPLAVDSEVGAMGTIGPKGNCYKWPFPIPAPVKVVVKAKNGAGPIGAQLYSK